MDERLKMIPEKYLHTEHSINDEHTNWNLHA